MVRTESLTINHAISACDRCHLRAQKGLGIGNPQARVLLLAQNPGRPHELNLTLVPFEWHLWNKGAPGKGAAILRRALLAVKLPLYDLYVTNIMKCQGTVQDLYVTTCRTWLTAELAELPRCELIVALGAVAGKAIGIWESHRVKAITLGTPRPYMATFVNHPASLLYAGGLSFDAYVDQWEFVASVYRHLKERP